MGGWVDVKDRLKIAYSNKKLKIINHLFYISELLVHNTRLQASTSGSSTVVLASENSLKRPFMDSDDVDSSAKKAFTEDISGS
jgi:hypothetical protein